jgi:hypothetical protein
METIDNFKNGSGGLLPQKMKYTTWRLEGLERKKEVTSWFKRPDLQYRTNWSSIRHWLEGRPVALH